MNLPVNRPRDLSHMRVLMLVVIAMIGLIRPSITFAQPDSESNQQILAATENLLTHYLELNQGDIAISAIGNPAEVALGPEYIKEYVFNQEYLSTGVPSAASNAIAWHGVWLATLNHANHSIGTVRIASPTATRNHYSPTEIWDLGCSRNLQAFWQPNDLVVNHLPENEMYILRGNQAIALCVWTQQALGITPVSLGTLHQYLAGRSNAHLPPTEALGIYLTSMPPLPPARLTTEAVSSSIPIASATPIFGSSALSHRLGAGTWAGIGAIGLAGMFVFAFFLKAKFTR
jgi:hypothetical protein